MEQIYFDIALLRTGSDKIHVETINHYNVKPCEFEVRQTYLRSGKRDEFEPEFQWIDGTVVF